MGADNICLSIKRVVCITHSNLNELIGKISLLFKMTESSLSKLLNTCISILQTVQGGVTAL